ncbi:MAG: hypothetical protein N2201_02540 [candidate division WOR-3 bacterium]|nr:hypothetical protein [candidate division WOR-3 bacterium]
MPIIWEDVKTWLKDTTKLALKEAEDLTYKGKIKLQIFSLEREKDRLLQNLGEILYTEYKKHYDPTKMFNLSEKMIEIINRLQKTEEKIKQKKEELKTIK